MPPNPHQGGTERCGARCGFETTGIEQNLLAATRQPSSIETRSRTSSRINPPRTGSRSVVNQ